MFRLQRLDLVAYVTCMSRITEGKATFAALTATVCLPANATPFYAVFLEPLN